MVDNTCRTWTPYRRHVMIWIDYSPCLRQGPVDEEIDGFVGAEGQSLSEDPHELGDRDFEGDEELVLVQVHQVGFRCSLDNDRDPVGILLQDLP